MSKFEIVENNLQPQCVQDTDRYVDAYSRVAVQERLIFSATSTLSRFIGKTLRINKNCQEKFLKILLSESTLSCMVGTYNPPCCIKINTHNISGVNIRESERLDILDMKVGVMFAGISTYFM